MNEDTILTQQEFETLYGCYVGERNITIDTTMVKELVEQIQRDEDFEESESWGGGDKEI